LFSAAGRPGSTALRRWLRAGCASPSCDVLLALIGYRWLTITDQDGQQRLDKPGDFVRLEVEAASARDVRVIPILMEGARMSRDDELPPAWAA
jgi:hypothetical protein